MTAPTRPEQAPRMANRRRDDDAPVPAGEPRRRKRAWRDEAADRGILSARDRHRSRVRLTTGAIQVVALVGLLLAALGPLLWLVKAATSTTQDIIRRPLALWPDGFHPGNLADAWNRIDIDDYLLNTFWVAGGSSLLILAVATTGAYALAILRPKYAPAITGAILATLFVPGVISLVPLYLTILDVPIVGLNLMNSFWAVWLPAAANSFIVLIVIKFFERLPRDLFDAAKVDGAGAVRIFWSIVLPMSKPILGVVALLSFINAWKDYLWPLLVLPDPQKQPLSVALPRLAEHAEHNLFMAGLLISVVVPVLLFLLFQRNFLRAASQAGALKG